MTLGENPFNRDYKSILKSVNDQYANQPGITDVHEVRAFLGETRMVHLDLITAWGKIQKDYTVHMYSFVKNCPEEIYKKIKNSSTLVEQAAMATFPHAEEYYAIKDLLRFAVQISPEYNTLISAAKIRENV